MTFGLLYGYYSRVVCNQDQVIMVGVQYEVLRIFNHVALAFVTPPTYVVEQCALVFQLESCKVGSSND